ncbi:MAG: flagellar M-ring protein FliF [Oscillospiraceae bacterium]|jgi:flagellar M-ring protein FliF|nr:flagellar M-ring protein FliF [Oscillospiraceae bacterium]
MNKVTETAGRAFTFVKDKWLATTRTFKVILIAVAAAVILAIAILAAIMGRTDYEVLYTGMSAEETAEVITALQTLGYTDIHTGINEISIPSASVDTARMDLAIQGFPKSTFNFDLWANSVDMFSTDGEKQEIKRQQLILWLRAALNTLDPVVDSTVIISMGEKDNYTLSSDKESARVSITLKLKEDKKLKTDQIEGIYNLVVTSVPGLEREQITIVGTDGIKLTPEDAPNGSEELVLLEEKYSTQLALQRDIQAELKQALTDSLAVAFRKFSLNVNVTLDFNNELTEETIYSPSNPNVQDPTRGGMVSSEVDKYAYGATAAEGGVVGTTVDADISPDYPTIPYDPNADVYADREKTVEYKVNELKRQYTKDTYAISKITASVYLDETAMSADELANLERYVATSIGTTPDMVTVLARPFALTAISDNVDIGMLPTAANRNLLIFIIIALGALLVILFLLAIMTGGSKKRRHVKARYAGAVAASGSGTGRTYEEDLFGSATKVSSVGSEPATAESFNLQSLLGDGGETKENVLKTEIKDFAKANPDIVAQLIRTWMRE